VSYQLENLRTSLKKVGIKKGDIIYLSGNLFLLGNFFPKKKILKSFYEVLISILGKKGTICFPTHSFNIISKKKLFNLNSTPSETGVVTEYLRKKKGSVRQDHPYASITSIGRYAKFICKKNTNNVYGPNSPFSRMIRLNSKVLNFGLEPRFCCTSVHHSEFMSKVPYRYNKKFRQKVKINKRIKIKNYYMFVIKDNLINIKRDKNKKIFKHFQKKNKILKTKLGKSFIYCYSLKKFYNDNMILFKKDRYAWLKEKPKL